MPSSAGHILVDDLGREIVDELGRTIVSDGASDCECCGEVPPDCCTLDDCTFNKATARLQGHVVYLFRLYTNNDCTGPLLHTLQVEFDFDIQMDQCGGCVSRSAQVPTNGSATYIDIGNADGSDWIDLSTLIATLDGVALNLVPDPFGGTSRQIILGMVYIGGGVWDIAIAGCAYPIPPFSGVGGLAGTSTLVETHVTGDCMGFASTGFLGCDGNGQKWNNSIEMSIVNNTGCS